MIRHELKIRTQQVIDAIPVLREKECGWNEIETMFNEILIELDDTPWHTGTPTEREWVLGIFREADTGWINPVPFVCEYLQGLKTKATTEEGWIIKDCTDIDQPCDYYKKLQCIAWQKIEPYKEEDDAKSNYDF